MKTTSSSGGGDKPSTRDEGYKFTNLLRRWPCDYSKSLGADGVSDMLTSNTAHKRLLEVTGLEIVHASLSRPAIGLLAKSASKEVYGYSYAAWESCGALIVHWGACNKTDVQYPQELLSKAVHFFSDERKIYSNILNTRKGRSSYKINDETYSSLEKHPLSNDVSG